MKNIDDVLTALSRSAFRRRFTLSENDRAYVAAKGLDTVLAHARGFIGQRLGPAEPARDGKQTPFRGHPVFVAQHATATCCRGCLSKWHGIARGAPLDSAEQDYVAAVIERWLRREIGTDDIDPQEPRLF
ncbi:DUF4186 domain-containing protein [uncultured Hyphomicrobium sp.]|uniref:DUF4186 domain-containing protein n=1 Tax=uncultured Hyphomicrobium sp. TaxID=194373 RepID=UPI0025EDE995|nr:DUF4186 domain-containing protein [uncultured Hyphomicrobium sp.]